MSGYQTTWHHVTTAINFVWSSIWHAPSNWRLQLTDYSKLAVTTTLHTASSTDTQRSPLRNTMKTRLDSIPAVSTLLQCYQHSGSNAARYTPGFSGSHCNTELKVITQYSATCVTWGYVLWLHIHIFQVISRYSAVQGKARALIDVGVSRYSTRVQICLYVLMLNEKHLLQLVTMHVCVSRSINSSWYQRVPAYNINTNKRTIVFWCNIITRVLSNMFLPLMWPSSVRYKQEYNYNYKSVRITPLLKIIV
jgi:hypothetical protein